MNKISIFLIVKKYQVLCNGIDIVAENNGLYYAVQCKYKKHTGYRKNNVLSWKVLSTFYALCLKTGPFEKYVVMTTCEYVRHAVDKNEKDLSICLKTFQNITKDEWLSMCNIVCNKLETETLCQGISSELRSSESLPVESKETLFQIDSKEELRQKRLAFYAGKLTSLV